MIVAFEGSHRAGKGTQIELLKAKLESEGREVFVFYEPCGREEANREFIEKLFSSGQPSAEEELRAFQEKRERFYKHLEKIKKQKPEAVVLVDRSVLSLEIQRIRGANEQKVRELQEKYLPEYDLIFVLDIGVEGSDKGYAAFKERCKKSQVSLSQPEAEGFYQEKESNPYREGDKSYHQELIAFYHQVAEGDLFPYYQDRIVAINGLAEREVVAQEVYRRVSLYLK